MTYVEVTSNLAGSDWTVGPFPTEADAAAWAQAVSTPQPRGRNVDDGAVRDGGTPITDIVAVVIGPSTRD